MDAVLLIARLLLSAVFGVAGITKLADVKGSRKAVEGFGVPPLFAKPLGILLPLGEIIAAALLLPVRTSWWGGLAALGLLLVFIVSISSNLLHGRKPDCHCFGQLHSTPIGWPTLLRATILAFVAAGLVWFGRGTPAMSVITLFRGLTSGQVVGLILTAAAITVLVVQGYLLLHLLRQNGRLLLRMEALETTLHVGTGAPPLPPEQPVIGLPLGSPAPAFDLPLLSGQHVTLDGLCGGGKPLLLIFSDPNCGPCTALLPDVARWQRENVSSLTLAIVSRGTVEANRAKAAEYGLQNVLLQTDREVAEIYRAHGTPSAVLVHANGTMASVVAAGSQAIDELVSLATRTALPTIAPALDNGHYHKTAQPTMPSGLPGLQVSDPAPFFTLPDLTGQPVGMADFRGRQTLLLFWNPSCGFCNDMLPDIKAWQDNRPNNAPELLLISTGTPEVNRAMALSSIILLDNNFSVGRAFGTRGTPSAVLVDGEGKIASHLAIGAQGILELARTTELF